MKQISNKEYEAYQPSSGMKESLIKPEKRPQPTVELSIYRCFHGLNQLFVVISAVRKYTEP